MDDDADADDHDDGGDDEHCCLFSLKGSKSIKRGEDGGEFRNWWRKKIWQRTLQKSQPNRRKGK